MLSRASFVEEGVEGAWVQCYCSNWIPKLDIGLSYVNSFRVVQDVHVATLYPIQYLATSEMRNPPLSGQLSQLCWQINEVPIYILTSVYTIRS